ncbi:unnamed protein product [Mycena citricolor]|uniref:Methylenetetrahydrofolate dehydrogenase n=1 Tax=Mycena citricolor TaxID=2018698 RepID=A0AAD2HI63_9AGAR|nr:unnamed protein product [Mycena citricolor]
MAGKGLLLKADPIADTFRDEVKTALDRTTRKPRLVGILATSSAPSKFYAEFTKKQCEDLGFDFVLKRTGAAFSEEAGEGEGVEEAIIEANEDPNVNGIMVYYPIFGPQQDHYLQQARYRVDLAACAHSVSRWSLHIRMLRGFTSSSTTICTTSELAIQPPMTFSPHANISIRFLEPESLLKSGLPTAVAVIEGENPPPGTVKSILPCTPLAIVKCLEHIGVYNKILPYGDRAYGRTVTVINRSEVVGRPLAALLANDGARVFSVDIDSIQEYTKRPQVSGQSDAARKYHPHHVVHPSNSTLQECLAISDVVISAVPSASYKVATDWLKDGCICVNVAADKNFEKNVRDKTSMYIPAVGKVTILMLLRNLLRLQQYKTNV